MGNRYRIKRGIHLLFGMKIIDSGENALSELIADILAVIIEDLAEISNILTPIYL